MKLPETCWGCPAFKEGATFVPDRHDPEAQMFVILQSPTYQAARTGEPDTTEIARGLRLSGVEDYSVGHMCRCLFPAMPKAPKAQHAWMAKLKAAAAYCAQYTRLPDVPIVVVGKETWKHYRGEANKEYDIYDFRGFRTEVRTDEPDVDFYILDDVLGG